MSTPQTLPNPAMDLMTLNDLDRWGKCGITLDGVRSAAAHVIDTAARHLSITRAEAHALMWPRALRLAPELPHTVTVLDALKLHPWGADHYRVRGLISQLSTPVVRTPHSEESLVHLLAGAVTWLDMLGEPSDRLAREDLCISLLLMDALAQHGITNARICDEGGRAPEHVRIGEGMPVNICTELETVSILPEEATGLFMEVFDEEDPTDFVHPANPVTLDAIAEIADLAAQAARELNLL